ncbi:Uncharacterized protein TCM_040725 [Theobroma cacao]|uniref:Uncharacterized protein n=1 Tax=Theobroma cacao TaxID=3641 RepID=A0A061GTJ2_THECC|nr:Uncharacterized protein TCM_040725 [Theobroma cacao]
MNLPSPISSFSICHQKLHYVISLNFRLVDYKGQLATKAGLCGGFDQKKTPSETKGSSFHKFGSIWVGLAAPIQYPSYPNSYSMQWKCLSINILSIASLLELLSSILD